LYCPSNGFHEFTRIAAPKKDCRSWLITGETGEDEEKTEETADGRIGSGYINKSADLFLATPIDVLFLVLPVLAPKNAKDTKQHFLAQEDYFDMLSSSSPHWKALLSQNPGLSTMLAERMRAVCDTVDAGEETMFRLSTSKLSDVLVRKAERMVKTGLPASLEEKFIKTALEVPVMSIKREESTISTTATETTEASQTSTATTTESQTSIETTITTPDEHPSKPTLTTPQEIPHLLRLRTSLTYLTTAYFTPTLRSTIAKQLKEASPTTPDFSPLDAHLSAIAQLKAEAAALRSISDNMSRKRAIEVDEEKLVEREEKKRKKEEDAVKKKMEGRGLKQLKKVDTSGMKKMSSFFKAAPKKT
jgi:hypothetical protein